MNRLLGLFIIYFISLGGVHAAEFSLDSKYEQIKISGEVNSEFEINLESILKAGYYQFSQKKENRSKIKANTSKLPIRKVTQLIKDEASLDRLRKNRNLQIFKYIAKMGVKRIVLNSLGGDVRQLIGLGIIVKELNIDIVVPENGICASACTYLFHQASQKSLLEGAKLMYHLGVVLYGDNIFSMNRCTPYNLKECKGISTFTLKANQHYIKFLESLPQEIYQDIIDGKDRWVVQEEFLKLMSKI